MRGKSALVSALVCALLLCACQYIVLPEDLDSYTVVVSKGWSAVATRVSTSDAGALHIDLTIHNETGDWSAMQAATDRPAVLRTGDGKTSHCDTVFVGTGGHRLAPGFRMRGYIGGTQAGQKTQLIYVECQGAAAAPGSKLTINYTYVTGEYNYYYPDENKVDATLEVALDEVAADLTYPVADEIKGLALQPGTEITAINDVTLLLTSVERTDSGLLFGWQTSNPGEYPTYVHIGNPPVIGADGIIYGFYETPDIVSVPITPAGDKAQWTTGVPVPKEVNGLYILLSVESKKQRLFISYAVDITGR